MENICIIGWDAASDEKNNGLVKASVEDAKIDIKQVWKHRDPMKLVDTISNWIDEERKKNSKIILAVDCPMGWPIGFDGYLKQHSAGYFGSKELLEFPRRATDRKIFENYQKFKPNAKNKYAINPLDVACNLIARASFETFKRIHDIENKVKIIWSKDEIYDVGLIEVYPSVTIAFNDFKISPYKKKKWSNAKADNLDSIKDSFVNTKELSAIIKKEHDFDALICCIAAKDFLQGKCFEPEGSIKSVVEKEGWIWVKDPTK